MKPFISDYGTSTDATGATALTTSFLSLTASIIYVGELVGAMLAAPINDFFGRKIVFYCASVCIIIGAIVQLVARGSEGLIILGRILIGLGIGKFTVTCLLYIGEVAPVSIRGPALMMFQFMQSCSQLVGSGITQGTESIPNRNSYLIPFGLLVALPGLMAIFLPFIPESPTWYVAKGRMSDAEKALQKIHKGDNSYDVGQELQILQEAVERQKIQEAESSWASLIKDPIERRKLLYSCGAMVAQQINGIQFFYSYGVVFAQSIGIEQAFTISLITNVLQVIAVGASVLLGNKVPRRKNLLICTLGLWASLLVVGGLGTTRAPFTTGISAAIVVFSYIVIVCFNFSLGPLAFTIASEMAVGRNRNKIMSCSIVSFFITVWVIAFTSPYLYYSANLGPMLGFVYAGTTFITFAYIWFCVGETKGRSNLELERFFIDKVPVRQWSTHQFSNDHSEIQEAKVISKEGDEHRVEKI